MTKLKYRYRDESEMKDSGVEWLGMIPKGWGNKRLKHFADLVPSNVDKKSKKDEDTVKLCNYVDVYYNDFITSNINFMIATANSNQIEKLTLLKGDIILTKDSESPDDIAISTFVNENLDNVVCGYHLILIRPNDSTFSKYIYRLISSIGIKNYFATVAKGVTRYGIGVDAFRNLLLSLPALETQQKIADFLDLKTARFDSIIEKKEKLIKKLVEAKKSLISEVVTGKKEVKRRPTLHSDAKGIPTPPNTGLAPLPKGDLTNGDFSWEVRDREEHEMKDSGVEWLGMIPKEWRVTRLKYLGNSIIGLTYSPNDIVGNSGHLVLRSSNIQNGKLSLKNNVYVNKKIPKYLITQKGDILICSRNGSRNLIGKNIMIDSATEGSTFGAFMTIYRSMYNNFLYFVLNSNIFKSQSGSFLTSTVNQLTINNLNNFIISFPSIKEQEKVVDFLHLKTAKIDTSIEKIKLQINKLKEAKKSLISEVVTGKIEVFALEGGQI